MASLKKVLKVISLEKRKKLKIGKIIANKESDFFKGMPSSLLQTHFSRTMHFLYSFFRGAIHVFNTSTMITTSVIVRKQGEENEQQIDRCTTGTL